MHYRDGRLLGNAEVKSQKGRTAGAVAICVAFLLNVCAAQCLGGLQLRAYAADANYTIVSPVESAAPYETGAALSAQSSIREFEYETIQKKSGTYRVTYFPGNTEFNTWMWSGEERPMWFTSAKSSNSSVIAAGSYGGSLGMTVRKPGTTKLTYKLNGKKHSLTLKVVKYVSPARSFKVGSVDATKVFNKGLTCKTVKQTLSGKVRIEVGKGWVLKSITARGVFGTDKSKRIKNGSVIGKSNKVTVVSAVFKSKSTGKNCTLVLRGRRS